MKLENVVALIGGCAALLGCFLPFVWIGDGRFYQSINHIGGLSLLIYPLSLTIIATSILALYKKLSKVEVWQITCGILGLLLTGYLYLQIHGFVFTTSGGKVWGVVLLFWGFALSLVDGLVFFREPKKVKAEP